MTELDKREEEAIFSQYLLEQSYIDPTTEVEYPPVALSYGESDYYTSGGTVTHPTPIGTYGNFSFIQGPPKHKKTFLVTLLSAAYLGDCSSEYVDELRGHRDGKCLYHFDTEQGTYHAQKVFSRALQISGKDKACYMTYGLRSLSVEERLNVIEYCLSGDDNIGLVVIDGVADLVNDVNNIEESNKVVQKLMTWSEKYNIHILTVVHVNHNSTKPTGHLGSAMEKKAETQIALEKSELNENIINVKCKSSRGRPFDSFSFMVNKQGLPFIVGADIEIFKKNNNVLENLLGNTR